MAEHPAVETGLQGKADNEETAWGIHNREELIDTTSAQTGRCEFLR
jgi:hypothetical protein